MGFAKRLSERLDDPIGKVGRGRMALFRGFTHGIGIDFEIGDHGCHRGQRDLDRIGGVEDTLLVFLKIAAIGEYESLHHGGERHEIAENAPGLAADQFGGVGIAFLRHDGGAGGECVRQAHEAQRRRRPLHDLACEPRQMGRGDRGRGEVFERKIARRDGVERISHRSRKAQRLGRAVAVDGKRSAGERRCAERRFVQPLACIGKAAAVTIEHFDIGQAMMAERHRLRRLHVRVARHDGREMRFRLDLKRALQCLQRLICADTSLAQPEAKIGHDLVVARARRVQAPGRIANQLLQPRFDVEMDVFELAAEGEFSIRDFFFNPVEALNNHFTIGLGNDLLPREHVRVRPGAGDILGRQPFVEIDGGRYDLHDGCRTALEPSAPHFVRNHETPVTLFRWPYIVLGAAVLSVALWAVLYGMPGRTVHAYAAPPASLAPFTAHATPLAVPQVAFSRGGGTRIALSQLKGRYVLLNLWAPWCAPCVRELPALAHLQSSIPSDRLSVIAVDVGRGTPSDARRFLDAHGSKALATYVDSNLALLRAFGALGLPLTILIDPNGREVGRALGAATWDSPEALDYFRALTSPRAAS